MTPDTPSALGSAGETASTSGGATVEDPRAIIARQPMGLMQVLAIATCVLLNALDGFDVLSISFASPGIAAEWGIDRAVLGLVLSMELIGMAVGSIVIGGLADRIGRRPVVIGSLVVMAIGMALATTAHDVSTLSAFRLFTGLGIGGMLATINAAAAEFSNARRRNLAVALMAGGYPLGAIVGGSIASSLLADGTWRSVFAFGAIATVAFLPLVWFFLPETVAFVVHRRPAKALERVNAVLRRLGHGTVAALPAPSQDAPRATVAQLFAPGLARTTVLLTIAYFAHIMTFYFILKWIPKIVVDMGYAPSTAGGVLVWANVGGATGALAAERSHPAVRRAPPGHRLARAVGGDGLDLWTGAGRTCDSSPWLPAWRGCAPTPRSWGSTPSLRNHSRRPCAREEQVS